MIGRQLPVLKNSVEKLSFPLLIAKSKTISLLQTSVSLCG
jgi:hypothetical protein